MRRRYGRHVEHDPRSRAFPARVVDPRHRDTVLWRHFGPVLDQGGLGACTGFALVQCLNSGPYAAAGRPLLGAADAKRLYAAATVIDGIPGQYPPDDTGSSGLAVCKAGKAEGLLRGYRHAFGLDHLLGALQRGPLMVGTGWTASMSRPDSVGMVAVHGRVVGGHEYVVLGVDYRGKWLICLNSWGPTFGLSGTFKVRLADMDALLERQGDVTVPRR